jgi:hypothetical protein
VKRLVLAALLGIGVPLNAVQGTSALAVENPIVVENQQPGSWGWLSGPLVSDDATGQIKGYASATSVNQNESITFYVTVNPVQTYRIDVYRIGWYGGYGGRLHLQAGPLSGVQQPPCVSDATTGLIACGWAPSYTLTVPGSWTSGLYFAVLTNAQGYQNHIVFVVKDGRPAPFLYQQGVTTDQAYNNYPADGRTGKSLYSYNSYGPNTIGGDARAVKVSFDRPYTNYGFFEFDEIEFIRWIERSGYDVTYITDIDTHRNGSELRRHKALLSVGHDEYWSKQMYDAAEAARDAGVGLAFFAADSNSAQVRFEPSVGGVADRVMVAYKNPTLDPVYGPTTTVRWRVAPLNRPEQTLRGIQFTGQMSAGSPNVDYVVTNSSHWMYTGTGFKDGDVVAGIVGYEMDRFMPDVAPPNSTNLTLLSRSPFTNILGTPDYANSSIYQAPSGAWVFSSGTISWSWALDGIFHGRADPRIQRTTANLLNAFLYGAPAVRSLEATAPPSTVAGQSMSVKVRAKDGRGDLFPQYGGTVHFSTSDGSPDVRLPPDARLIQGEGSFPITLATAGSQTLTVTDAANALSTTVSVVVNAQPADHLALGAASTTTAGEALSFTVTAKDRFGNTDPSYSGKVHFTSSDPSAFLPSDAALLSGQGTFSATLTRTGPQTIVARDTITASITGTLAITVLAPVATELKVVAAPAVTAGDPLTLTVTARDARGNTVTSYSGTVHFSSTDPSADLPPDSRLTSGVGTFAATLKKAGSQTLTLSDAANSLSTTVTVTVSAQTAHHYAVTTAATPTAGSSFSFSVTALDAFGNIATGYTGKVHFSSSDASASLPSDATTTGGQGTFAATLKKAGPQAITATDTLSASLTGSMTVTARAAQAASLSLSAPATATAGQAVAVSVTVRDAYENIATGYAGKVRFASSDTSAGVVLPPDSTLSGGQGTFSVTLTRAGAQTISAKDTLNPSLGAGAAITVGAASAATLALTAPATAAPGQAFTVNVTLKDAFGNVATGYAGRVHFTTSDPLLLVVLPSDYTFTSADRGSHSFTVTLWSPGGQTLTVRDLAIPDLSGTRSIAVALLPPLL